jgi:hypothetical protein
VPVFGLACAAAALIAILGPVLAGPVGHDGPGGGYGPVAEAAGWLAAGWAVSALLLWGVARLWRPRPRRNAAQPASARTGCAGGVLLGLFVLCATIAGLLAYVGIQHNPQDQFRDSETGALHLHAVMGLFGGNMLVLFLPCTAIALLVWAGGLLDKRLGTN